MDLFEHPELIPKEVADIIDTHNEDADQYKECGRMQKEMEAVGYTFSWGLCGTPYNLRKNG
jgi:hypothetical protein